MLFLFVPRTDRNVVLETSFGVHRLKITVYSVAFKHLIFLRKQIVIYWIHFVDRLFVCVGNVKSMNCHPHACVCVWVSVLLSFAPSIRMRTQNHPIQTIDGIEYNMSRTWPANFIRNASPFSICFFFVYFCFWDGNELPFIRSVFVYMSAFYWSGFSRRFQFSIVGDFALLMRTIQWHCELLGGTEYECTVRKKITRQTRLGWQQQAASNAVVDYVLTTCAAAHQIHKPLLGRLFLCGCVDCCLIEK